ncbi:ABC transporter ATP-binding protein [Haloarcula amylovorans]|uniref:ABC transporter ATP-binding protein n=1 Tax=Haloarcula amylovorans TaxID=2562280 RepID=UPI001FD84E76|nr:ABC transporter ATP-binding protein [Halomicroarcula amylolytica]
MSLETVPGTMDDDPEDVEGQGAVQLENLRKEFGDTVAVDGIDLDIRPGEFLTLLGPSGCGKSTTLRMISGLETPTDGDVFISGDRVTPQAANKRNTSMVFQEWALFPHMTVGENVSFGLEMDGVSKSEREGRIEQALEMVELPGYQDRPATELSGGQKQRVAMARALVREPDVLLLDEPLASLDRKLRQHMQVELKQIQEELGTTFIYVTHDQEEALTMSDRIAVIDGGEIAQIGTANDLYEHPNTKFVATFLGETNIFEGTLRSTASGSVVETGDVDIAVAESSDRDGESVAVAVRPERIAVADRGADLGVANEWTGTVTETIYKGSFNKYGVDVGGTEIQIEQQVDGSEKFEAGETVTVGFDADAVEIVPE